MELKLSPGLVVAKRYEVVQPLKAGGMGAVYRARDLHFADREVALKQMHEELWEEGTRELLDRKFTEEANILVGLTHPGIPQVLDHFISGDDHFIIMELIRGDSLDKVVDDYLSLTGRPVPLDMALDWGVQLCRILEYLHSREPHPIIHRDVKPGNVILRREENTVVLVDFGLARGIRAESMSTKTLVGTVGYAPMEQFQGRPEQRSDLYSLAATLHHMISGLPPVPFAIPPLRDVMPEADPELERVLKKALAMEVGDRHSDAAALRADLEAVRERTMGRPEPEAAPRPRRSAPPGPDLVAPAPDRADETRKAGEPRRGAETRKADLSEPEPAPEEAWAAPLTRPAEASVLPELPRFTRKQVAAALVVVLALLGAAAITAARRQVPLFGVFQSPSAARARWAVEFERSVEARGGRVALKAPGRGEPAGLIFRSRQPMTSLPRSVEFTVEGKVGDPTWLAVIGPLGLLARDDPTQNAYTVQVVRTRASLIEDDIRAPQLDPLDVQPLVLPVAASKGEHQVKVVRGAEDLALTVNGQTLRVPAKLVPPGDGARLGLVLLAPRQGPEEALWRDLQVDTSP